MTKNTNKNDEDDEVKIEDEEEGESEKQTLLIRKRKGEDETSGWKKKEKKPRAKESKDPIPLVIITPPAAQTLKTTISPSLSKCLKQPPSTSEECPHLLQQSKFHLPKNPNRQTLLPNLKHYYYSSPVAREKSSISCRKLTLPNHHARERRW